MHPKDMGLWLLLATACIGVSCAIPGDRAALAEECERFGNCESTCPVGETCSDSTPSGLYFRGALVASDLGLVATAVGGTQTFHVYTDSLAEEPYDEPFDATISGSALGVVELAAPDFVLIGESEGRSTLRLVEPETDLLLERISLEARAATDVGLFVVNERLPESEEGQAFVPTSYWADTSQQIGFAVYDAQGDRLVDQSLTAASLSIGFEQLSWYRFSATPDVGSHEIEVSLGNGVAYTLALTAVDEVDELTWIADLDDPILSVDSFGIFCFAANREGAYVVGVDWEFTGSAGISVEPLESLLSRNCVLARAESPGTETISASAGGLTMNLQVEAVASLGDKRVVVPRDFQTTAGERAAGGVMLP